MSRSSNHRGRIASARRHPALLAAAALTCSMLTGLAADYIIEPGAGDTFDFALITPAVQPGDTIYLRAQTKGRLTLKNIQGTAANPITITNLGGQFVYDATTESTGDTWRMLDCKHVILKGTPSPGNYDYGIRIAATKAGQFGLYFAEDSSGTITGSSDFEVADLEIGNTGFAGLGIKCDTLTASGGFVMENIKIHGLYIHNTGGEGMYIGSSAFATSDVHEIHNIEIYDNVIENTKQDGIQLGAATVGASIHHNFINGYGVDAPSTDQDEGIRINPGTAADVYNNVIIGSPTNSGTGIFANPYGDAKYYNNVIVTPQERGIYILRTEQAKGYISGYTVLLMNNTIVKPGTWGIEFANPSSSSGNRILNNLIVEAPSGQNVLIHESLVGQIAGNSYPATIGAAGFLDSGENKFDLLATSPAVDAGIDVSAYGVTEDTYGYPRPQGSTYDAGAFEYTVPLSFSTQPASRTVNAGANVTFSVVAAGAGTLAYQWHKDGVSISGATASSLTLTNVQAGDAGSYTVVVTNFTGSLTSNAATLTLTTLPTIATQPAGQIVGFGASVTFSVVANGPGTLTYQWRKDGTPISGATASSLVLTNVQAGSAAGYSVVITNANGSTTSDTATLTVVPAPAITLHPMSQTVNLGVNLTLVVAASGTGPFTYQWKKDNVDIGGATSASLALTNIQTGSAGGYAAVVTGPGGSTASNTATLTVNNTTVTTLIAIAGFGQAGAAYCPATGAFNEQPVWDDTNQVPAGVSASPYVSTDTGYVNRTWFIDFGANYADLTITGTWTRYMPSTTGSYAGFGTMWWDDDNDATNDNGVTATGLNFGTAQSLNTGAGQPWVRDSNASSSPITPPRRYLLINTGAAPTTRANEFAVTGNAAPPTITTQPANQTANLGANVTFSVVAGGTGAFTYQWKKNNSAVSGATSSSLALTNVQLADAGAYSVVVTAPGGSITSNSATLTVNDTTGILAVAGYGQAGAAYCPATGTFNEQPAWDAVNLVPTGISANAFVTTDTGYANRTWYVDFGANYAQVRITGTWTRYLPYTTASYSGFGTMWWDDDNDATNDDGVAATGLNFGTAQNLNTGASQPWVRDTDNSGAPVVPQRRYLLITTGAAPTTRANEFAFSGYVVP